MDLGTITFTLMRCPHYGCTYLPHLLPLVVLDILSSSMTFLHPINLCCWYFVPSGVDPHMIWEGSHLVWISLWLAIHWHMMPSAAILSAGLGVVVAPWHRHYPAYFYPWKDCSPAVGVLVTAWWVVLNLLLPTTRDDLYYTTTLWNKTEGQRSHIQQQLFTEYFK